MRMAELLEALNQRDTQKKIADETNAGSSTTAFLNAIKKARDWSSKIVSTPNIDVLAVQCRADGRWFDYDCVSEYSAKLIADHGFNRLDVNRMSIKQFAAEVAKLRKGKPAKKELPVNKYGRPPEDDVAKRREAVKRLRKKDFAPGEIAAELFEMQRKRKLPATVKISVDIVKSDIRRG